MIRALLLLLLVTLSGCNGSEHTLKVAATPVPHADILEIAKSELADQGIILKIVEVDDYNLPNRLLYEGQVDANFFQHQPYLDEQNRQFGFNLVPLVKIHIEPIGIYSEVIDSLEEIREGATVAIPSDPTNEARALKLLADVGLIKLKPVKNQTDITPLDIEENPKNLKFEEIDAPFLPRALPDVEIAVIPANFALQANLNPEKDALALEEIDSPYANIVAVRAKDLNREDLQKLKKVLNSEKMRSYIEEKYDGAIVPVF